jgi:hypothetical protein
MTIHPVVVNVTFAHGCVGTVAEAAKLGEQVARAIERASRRQAGTVYYDAAVRGYVLDLDDGTRVEVSEFALRAARSLP